MPFHGDAQFPAGGRYRLFADFTPPGKPSLVRSFDIDVEGAADSTAPVNTDTVERVRFRPDAPRRIEAGREIMLVLTARETGSCDRVPPLEPCLGAWARFGIAGATLDTLIHAHPIHREPALAGCDGSHQHTGKAEARHPAAVPAGEGKFGRPLARHPRSARRAAIPPRH